MLGLKHSIAIPLCFIAMPSLVSAQGTGMDNGNTMIPPKEDNQALTRSDQKPTPPKVDGQIVVQKDRNFLASELIGAKVFSARNKEVGDVNDIIVTPDGSVRGIVVGVGGFLGIGEKDVALTMDRFSASAEEDRTIRLTLNVSKAELEAAPRFRTSYQQYLQEQQKRPLITRQGAFLPDTQLEPNAVQPGQPQQ